MKINLIIYTVIICTVQAVAQDPIKKITLSNGVEISNEWPPVRNKETERKEMPVPYLENRQELIPINVGRQLFVDDFLIKSTNLVSVYHTPEYSSKNPVLKPDREWESNSGGPYAAPFSDGIWFDEKSQKFKMWYLAGAPGKGLRSYYTCYAESDNGINWLKPNLGIYGQTNIVDTINRDASTIWLDKTETDPLKRFKMFCVVPPNWQYVLKYSADGIYWSKMAAKSGKVYDRSTAFYNPFKNKWALSVKISTPVSSRSRSYAENEDPELLVASSANRFDIKQPDGMEKSVIFWFTPDDKEPRNPKFPEIEPAIYNFDAIAYESLMLGFYSVWQGPDNNTCRSLGIQKRNEVLIGYSRDGFHFSRPSHKPFMGVNETEGAWNWGNVQSIVGAPIIMGDSLYLYVSGRRINSISWDSHMSTGLSTLRRDGFMSLESNDNQGYLLTQKTIFNGKFLFVNADIPAEGELRVEILDENNRVIKGYGKADCIPMKENSTKYMIRWKRHDNISELIDKPVHFRFLINKGAIYSFWVSSWITGESRGYTAGGGPGLSQSGIDKK